MSETTESKGRGPRPFTVIAGVCIAAVLGIAVFVALGVDRDDEPGTDPTPEASTSAEPGAGEAAAPLEAAPTDVEWVVEHGLMLPVSQAHGPTAVGDDGVPTGFTQTPEGALLAAIQILARSDAPFEAATCRAVIAAGFVAGPDADALLAAVTDEAPASTADTAVVAGFAQHSYTASESVIELVMDAGGGQYVSALLTVVWDEAASSWRIVPPAGGDWSVSARVLSTLSGVIAWGP